MKPTTITLFLIILLSPPLLFAQINYENGYFINNKDELTKCQIRNTDWDYNPVSFKYRLNDSDEVTEASIGEVKEFGIDGFSKFIRKTVYIDRSPMDIDKLSMRPDPEWSREQLFLKVLVDGQKTLFIYTEHNFRRFFYTSADSVKQLVFKEYAMHGSRVGLIGTNNAFRKQLSEEVSFPKSEQLSRNISYFKNELTKYFTKYNEFKGDSIKVYQQKKGRDFFNLNVSTGINATSVSINNILSDSRDTEFDRKFAPRVALEAEFVLPFNKNKWSIILEPSFSTYTDSKEVPPHLNTISIKTLDLSLVLRHYFYLNPAMKIYGEASINSFLTKDLNSYINLPKYSTLTHLNNVVNFGFGAGISYKRITVGLRYYTPEELLEPYSFWVSELNKVAVVVGIKVID